MKSPMARILLSFCITTLTLKTSSAFAFHANPTRLSTPSKSANHVLGQDAFLLFRSKRSSIPFQSIRKAGLATILHSSDEENDDVMTNAASSSDQLLLGGLGTLASLVTFYSEYTLFTTGCGLPAGPFGMVGLVEGLSYLAMLGIVSYSVVTKIKTGSGLSAGPFGLLGAAEGLSFLAILAGLVVLLSQVTNYGYIPNAIPMEGGMCS